MKYFKYITLPALVVCFSISLAAGQGKVVVVPLGGKKCSSPIENSFTNSIGMTFNQIPKGSFIMGSPGSEPGHNSNEIQHQVILTRSFFMQTTEVTNKQWNTLIFDAGLGAKPSQSNTDDEYPVETVNWYEAIYFAIRLSVVEGLSPCYSLNGCNATAPGAGLECTAVEINVPCTGYRLPTEAEWEYAARAGTVTAYANPYSFDYDNTEIYGGFNSNLAAMGWYAWNNTTGGYANGTKPVAQQQANRWGLYDMHGNVWEWCHDWHGDYPSGTVTDPGGPVTGTYRMERGGGWLSSAEEARSAFREWSVPSYRGSIQGFRLVLPVEK